MALNMVLILGRAVKRPLRWVMARLTEPYSNAARIARHANLPPMETLTCSAPRPTTTRRTLPPAGEHGPISSDRPARCSARPSATAKDPSVNGARPGPTAGVRPRGGSAPPVAVPERAARHLPVELGLVSTGPYL